MYCRKEKGKVKSWEIEIKILADDFGLPRSLVKSAIKKAKDKVVPEFYNGNEENFRYDEAHRLIMPYILGI
jgi:hypothetical protein